MRAWGNIDFGGAPLGPLEPTGTWFATVDNEVVYSRDGKNWQRTAYGGGGFDTSYRWEEGDGTMALLAVDINGESFKMNNQGVPDFSLSAGGAGPGNTQWIAHGSLGWVARTTTQLRLSGDAINWSDNDASAPVNWSDINGGQFKYMSTAGLYMSMGSTFNAGGDEDQYWTSANRTTWTQRTFPVNWTANGQGGNVDWLVEDVAPGVQSGGTIMVMGMQIGGAIYSSTDGINWTLRYTNGANMTGLCWNEAEGAFYATFFQTNPDNLVRSTDGITWTAVNPNNLDTFLSNGQLACDPVKNLMYCTSTSTSSAFSTNDTAVSDDGGTTWSARWGIGGRWWGHVNFKVGPVIDESLVIDPAGPILVADAQANPTDSFARFTVRRDCTLDQQTTSGGIVQLGWWTNVQAEDWLNSYGREVRVDQLSGPALNFNTGGAAVNVWQPITADKAFGYRETGFGVLLGTFTVRFRDSITLVESAPVNLTISAEST